MRAFVFLCSLFAACRSAPTSTASPAPSASASAPLASAAPDAAPALPLVDLLYRTHARVTVSSNVANPRDWPEHLVDRRLDTAWNGKTGQLDGWIDLEVPKSARVRQLAIVVGYAKHGSEGDLFTMNHRVKKLRILREGVAVGDFSLDPNVRAPQTIALDLEGGKIRVQVLETEPGSKSEWRELVVSELALLGTVPDSELLPPAMPQVSVGESDRTLASDDAVFDAVKKAAPYPTLEALCARWIALADVEMARRDKAQPDIWREEVKASCTASHPSGQKPVFGGAFLDARNVTATEASAYVDRLVVRTARGWFPTDVLLERDYFGPNCGNMRAFSVDGIDVVDDVLTVRVTKHEADWFFGNQWDAASRTFIACVTDEKSEAKTPLCHSALIASFEDASMVATAMAGGSEWKVQPPRWDWTREVTLDKSGSTRLGPCKGPKGEVECRATHANLLLR